MFCKVSVNDVYVDQLTSNVTRVYSMTSALEAGCISSVPAAVSYQSSISNCASTLQLETLTLPLVLRSDKRRVPEH